jgi:hypothetical protein
MAPSSEYLLFDAQPPSTTLYTPSGDIAMKKSSPMFMSTTPIPGAIGTTANASKVVKTITTGASTKIPRSANGGTQSSFISILMASATICSTPKGPTRFGP